MRLSPITISAAWLLTAGLVLAQPPDAAEQAKARWKEGASALARGDAEGARVAFKQAYDLMPDAELAQSLGEAEFRTGHFDDAARHLTKALENRQLSPDERRMSTRSLQKALTKVGQLFVEVNVPGAELRIDGRAVTVTLPLRDAPWYLNTGAHTITVRKDGFLDATQNVIATPGQEIRASLTLSPELNEELFKPPPLDAPKDTAPKAVPVAAPDPGNPPPPAFFIGEGAIALAAIGSGAYFALKPGSDSTDKTVAAALIASGAFVAVAALVISLATPPLNPPSSLRPRAVRRDIPRLRVTF
jgi:hypothetical protein